MLAPCENVVNDTTNTVGCRADCDFFACYEFLTASKKHETFQRNRICPGMKAEDKVKLLYTTLTVRAAHHLSLWRFQRELKT